MFHINYKRSNFLLLIFFLFTLSNFNFIKANDPPANGGNGDTVTVFTYNPPSLQRGNTLAKPLPSNSRAVSEFLSYYNKYTKYELPKVLPDSSSIIAFPSQKYSYTGVNPGEKTTFTTSSYCQPCHDGTQTLADVKPNMMYLNEDHKYLLNWSEFGDLSVSLMGLSARDPVFHAQVETERDRHPGVPGTDIDNICYSCHGAMGQKQIAYEYAKGDSLPPTEGGQFNHYMIYSTPDNFHPTTYPYNEKYAGREYSRFASLARDGISCELCHHIGPQNDKFKKMGKEEIDWTVFYGPKDEMYTKREGDEPGPPFPFTSNFQYTFNSLIVPDNVSDTEEPMIIMGMAKSQSTNYIKRSELCGTCHVVIVPKIPIGYKKGEPVKGKPGQKYTGDAFTDPNVNLAYEQTTYFEFVNSSYEKTNIECQSCHMPGVKPEKSEVVNVGPAWYEPKLAEDYPAPERTYNRHRLLGINLFVHEMFQQFYTILGLSDPTMDNEVPENTAYNLLNAEQSIIDHATNGPLGPTVGIKIINVNESDGYLTTTVKLKNNAGHKFPTGAGFRRGFIEFRVLDENAKTIWVSGQTNQFGVILDGDGKELESEFTTDYKKLEPHREVITAQDQVQIYEERTLGEDSVLTSKTLSLFYGVKDNRILPAGWASASNYTNQDSARGLSLVTMANITEPESKIPGSQLSSDPYYNNKDLSGYDEVTYKINLAELKGKPYMIKAVMNYQTIPPYFLVERYDDGYEKNGYGTATERLIYLTSRLNTNLGLKSSNTTGEKFDVIKNWTMTLSTDSKIISSSNK